VLVGVAEAAQVGDDHVGAGQQRDHLAVVGAVAGPAVQEHHGGAATGPVVRQPEPVDGLGEPHPPRIRPERAVGVARRMA
jgi:hypothetical protein